MSDEITTPEAAETAPEAEPAKAEIDWKAKAREWESKAKANKTAADELATLKASQMSEQERLTAQLAELQKANDQARLEAMRYRVATQFGIAKDDAEEFLFGEDEETLVRKAQRFIERTQATASPRPVGDADLGTRSIPLALNGDPLEQALRTSLGIT